MSEDPIRFASRDVNFYRYTKNNPINFFDPLGKEEKKPSFWDDVKKDIGDFISDVEDFGDRMDDKLDQLEDVRRSAYCKMYPEKCGTDPLNEPIPEDDDINPKNYCPSKR